MSYNRPILIKALPIIFGVIYVIKLFFVQIISYRYGHYASSNVVKTVVIPPCRGLIADRFGACIVCNEPTYDILMRPIDLGKIDLDNFCSDFGISKEEFTKNKLKAQMHSWVQHSVIVKGITHSDWSRIQEFIHKYPSISVSVRTVRHYPTKNLAHALGYIAEINQDQLELDAYKHNKQGDLIGITGIENVYEQALSGIAGVQYKIVDVMGREQGNFAGGKKDRAPTFGANVTATVDSKLQAYGEILMKNKIGCIIAIEPSSGEILCMVSSPTYDPNDLSGSRLMKNFSKLSADPNKPLFNRATMATYPPGSIFKTVQALIALQMGVADYKTTFTCDTSFIKCHRHPPRIDMHQAIQYSCNPYFGYLFKLMLNKAATKDKYETARLGLSEWSDMVKSFGFGSTIAADLLEEKPGFVPNVTFYDNLHGKKNWKWSTIRSLDIGQGELLITPLQMANLACILANRGFFYKPHIIKSISSDTRESITVDKTLTRVDAGYFEFFVSAMQEAVTSGTARRCYIPNIIVCAKTGTAQNPHGNDHSVCIAFAPRETPQIALAVYVENAGWGPRAAAAIAGLMIEMYLNRVIKRTYMEDYVLKGDFE